ncbi:MAG: biotin-dependent carboxyltransferase family protein [Clostridia bacterium]|nr:biotin-dependent carboxyltransferase family protein [Clostridia bacterium]
MNISVRLWRGASRMGIQIVKAGLFTTVQDLGCVGYQNIGFSSSGAMDQKACKIANLLVDNDINEAVLEVVLIGPTIEFTTYNMIAVTGADLGPKLNGQAIEMYAAYKVREGDILTFTAPQQGCRAYVAFAGGLDVPVVMGSKSTNIKCKIGGYMGRRLQDHDYIGFLNPKRTLPRMEERNLDIELPEPKKVKVRVLPGPQDDYFTEEGIQMFFSEKYKVSNDFDRMGYKLEGPSIPHKETADIISDGIAFGAIQVPSHGKPIIMVADRQTTGGYAKIGNVISVDLPKVAQRKMGDSIRFQRVTMREAQMLYREEAESLESIRQAIKGENPELHKKNHKKKRFWRFWPSAFLRDMK